MKKLTILALLILLAGSLVYAKKKNEGEGVATLKEQIWDFGTIKKDKAVSHEFVFTNTGDGNLVILDAKADCGCTRPEYPQNPIAPGKTGKIKVTYNAIGRPGNFEKTVTLRTNGKPKTIRLKIRGNTLP